MKLPVDDPQSYVLKREWAVAVELGDKTEYGIPPHPKDVYKRQPAGQLRLYDHGDGEAFISCDNPMIVRR